MTNAASGPAPTLEMPLHGGGVDAQTASVVPDFRSSLFRPPLFAAKMPLGEEETHESSWCPNRLLCQDKCCVQMVPRVPGASWAASSLTRSRQCSSLHSHLPSFGAEPQEEELLVPGRSAMPSHLNFLLVPTRDPQGWDRQVRP